MDEKSWIIKTRCYKLQISLRHAKLVYSFHLKRKFHIAKITMTKSIPSDF